MTRKMKRANELAIAKEIVKDAMRRAGMRMSHFATREITILAKELMKDKRAMRIGKRRLAKEKGICAIARIRQ